MTEIDPKQWDRLNELLESVRRRLRALSVAVILMALVLALTVAAVFGQLVNYFAGDPLLIGSVSIGAALLGFFVGWIARRTA